MLTDFIVQISTDKLSLYFSKFFLKFGLNIIKMLNSFFLIYFVIVRECIIISHEEVENGVTAFKTIWILKHLFKKIECWSICFLNLSKYVWQLSIAKIFWNNQWSCIIFSKVPINFRGPVHPFNFNESVLYLSWSQVFSEHFCTEES
jgi:hypothetical protein